MKKNLITAALVISAMIPVRAQQLQNTYWMSYTTSNVFFEYFYFSAGNLSFSTDSINYTQRSSYVENGNMFTIVDLITAPAPCPPSDTGKYTFLIQNDTLRFSLISDPCGLGRPSVLGNDYFVRFYPAGIETLASGSGVFVYPNPSLDGIFNLTSEEFDKITVRDTQGGKVFEENILQGEQNHSINLQNLSSGIYFLTLQNDTGRRVFKIVK